MYINDIHIIYYILVGILGLGVGQFVDWCNIRLPEYKKVFSKEFFTIYMKKFKTKLFFSIWHSNYICSNIIFCRMGNEPIKSFGFNKVFNINADAIVSFND